MPNERTVTLILNAPGKHIPIGRTRPTTYAVRTERSWHDTMQRDWSTQFQIQRTALELCVNFLNKYFDYFCKVQATGKTAYAQKTTETKRNQLENSSNCILLNWNYHLITYLLRRTIKDIPHSDITTNKALAELALCSYLLPITVFTLKFTPNCQEVVQLRTLSAQLIAEVNKCGPPLPPKYTLGPKVAWYDLLWDSPQSMLWGSPKVASQSKLSQSRYFGQSVSTRKNVKVTTFGSK